MHLCLRRRSLQNPLGDKLLLPNTLAASASEERPHGLAARGEVARRHPSRVSSIWVRLRLQENHANLPMFPQSSCMEGGCLQAVAVSEQGVRISLQQQPDNVRMASEGRRVQWGSPIGRSARDPRAGFRKGAADSLDVASGCNRCKTFITDGC